MSSEDRQTTSLKDRLRKQAAEAEARERVGQERERRGKEVYEQQLLPAMQTALRYFGAVTADLQVIDSAMPVTIPLLVSSAAKLSFQQSDYHLYVDDEARPREMSVTCLCQLPVETTIHVGSLSEADDLEQFFREMGLTYYRRRQEQLVQNAEEQSRFVVEGEFHAAFSLSVDQDQARIVLQTQNLEDKPRRQYLLRPERVDEEFLESLGLLLLRESDTVIRTEVSSEFRQRLQSEIQRDAERKQRTLQEPDDGFVEAQGYRPALERMKTGVQQAASHLTRYASRLKKSSSASDTER